MGSGFLNGVAGTTFATNCTNETKTQHTREQLCDSCPDFLSVCPSQIHVNYSL